MIAKKGAQFKTVKGPRIQRNKFDLSHERRMSADMFTLTPVLCDMCIPGDKWRIGNEIIIRMNPLVAPIMHEIKCYVHYYFVPFRLLWDQWEKYITGGKDGKFTADLPRWDTGSRDIGSLWDYCGMNTLLPGQYVIKNPLVFPRRAYNMIYNEYYRDPNITDELDLDWIDANEKDLHTRCWGKDYFTSLLPWQQRGEAPAIPLQGEISAIFNGIFFDGNNSGNSNGTNIPANNYVRAPFGVTGGPYSSQQWNVWNQNIRDSLNINTINMEDATTFDVSDLRLAFQIQKFLERNARTGHRYPEFLKAHFPAWPRDDRLQRPEYIGGSKTPIVISEVLQTSSTDATTPQGNMAGHGLSADRTFVSTYNVQEHGLIMGIMSIMPKAMYSQGIDRVWLAETKYDFYFPEFANLSEQAVYTEEIYNIGPAPVDKVTGYQSRYDEYRYKRDTIHGLFRTDFKHWHMAREFANAPTLNIDLVRPNSVEKQSLKRILAVPSEPMFLITFGNRLHVTRPMPFMAEPGLIDHN